MASRLNPKRNQVRDEDYAVIRRLFEHVYSKGSLVHVTELIAPDFIGYSTESSGAYLGPNGVKAHVSRLREAFNGFIIEIDDLLVESDTYKVSWTARGTHERRVLGIEPTCNIGQAGEEPHGNRIAVSGIATGTIRNGKIQENNLVWDVKKLRRQLGSSVEDIENDTDSRESDAQKPLSLEREACCVVKPSSRETDSDW